MEQNPHTVKWATPREINSAYDRLLRAAERHGWDEKQGGKEALREFMTREPIASKDLNSWVAREEARMARSVTKSDLIEKYTEKLTKAYESHMKETLNPEHKEHLRVMFGRGDSAEEMEDIARHFEAELKTQTPVSQERPIEDGGREAPQDWTLSAVKGTHNGYDILILPPATFLYSGVSARDMPEQGLGRLRYFASLKTAMWYAFSSDFQKGTFGKVIMATTDREFKLLDMTSANNYAKLRQNYTVPEWSPGKGDILKYAFDDGARRSSHRQIDGEVDDFLCSRAKEIGVDGWGLTSMKGWHDEISVCENTGISRSPYELRYPENGSDNFVWTKFGKVKYAIPQDKLQGGLFKKVHYSGDDEYFGDINKQSDSFLMEGMEPVTDADLEAKKEEVLKHVESKRELDKQERVEIGNEIMESLQYSKKIGNRKSLEESAKWLKYQYDIPRRKAETETLLKKAIIAKPVEESPPITDGELKVWQEQILDHIESKREIDSKERTKIKADVMKSLKAVQKSGDRKALEKSIAFLKAFHAASKDTSNEEIAKDTETLLKKPTKAVVAPPLITPPKTAPEKKAKVETVKKEPVKTLLKPKAKVEKAVATSGPKTELQKAREKAKAWWALHPSGMNQDMAHKAKAVVKTADKYQPSRNDFKGVDDKKYSIVRWK